MYVCINRCWTVSVGPGDSISIIAHLNWGHLFKVYILSALEVRLGDPHLQLLHSSLHSWGGGGGGTDTRVF